MKIRKISNKKAAMEMSVGTIVTIVLLMSVLVLGIFLIQKIFGTAKGAIDMTEKQLYSELEKLYASNEDQRIIIYPQTLDLEIRKGKSDAFGLIINNRLEQEETFSYEITLADPGTCTMNEDQIIGLINLGKSRSNIKLGSGDILSNPLKIVFKIPESAKLCQVLYNLDVFESSGEIYDRTDLMLTIK